MKFISTFRIEPYGLFIDLADQDGRIGVDRETGDILLDEGNGPDRFHGAIIRAGDFRGLKLATMNRGKTGRVILYFGDERTHDLGATDNIRAAMEWIAAATRVIDAHAPAGPPHEIHTKPSAIGGGPAESRKGAPATIEQVKRALAIAEQIQKLEQEYAALLGKAAPKPAPKRSKKAGKHTFSAEHRAKLAAAAKARWTKKNGATKPIGAPKTKRALSPEARVKIVAAVKARWARAKASA